MLGFFSLLLLVGCTNKDEEKEVIKSTKLTVMSDLMNIDASFYKGQSMNYTIPCIIVTNQSLEGKDISFNSDINVPITFTMLETKEKHHDYNDFLVSKKLDWKDIANSLDENKLSQFDGEYKTTDMGMKDLYVYEFELNVGDNMYSNDENHEIRTIKMMVDDEQFTFDIGRVQFIKQTNEATSDDLLQVNDLSQIGKKTIANPTKAYKDDKQDWLYKVDNDITITDIIPLIEGQEMMVETIHVKDQENNEKDIPWNNKPIKIKKGSSMTIQPYFRMADNKEVIYHQSYDYKIMYTSGGKEYSHIMQSGIISTIQTAYKISNEKTLKTEYQTYYFDYASKE